MAYIRYGSGMNERGEHIVGTVKWYSKVRGFGFLVSETIGNDVIVHRTVLDQIGVHDLPDGSVVEFLVDVAERGPKVRKIISLNYEHAQPLGQTKAIDQIRAERESELTNASDFRVVTVKWFDWANGYGFLISDEDPLTDIFLHVETLRYSGINEICAGDEFEARVAKGAKGKTAILLRAVPND